MKGDWDIGGTRWAFSPLLVSLSRAYSDPWFWKIPTHTGCITLGHWGRPPRSWKPSQLTRLHCHADSTTLQYTTLYSVACTAIYYRASHFPSNAILSENWWKEGGLTATVACIVMSSRSSQYQSRFSECDVLLHFVVQLNVVMCKVVMCNVV